MTSTSHPARRAWAASTRSDIGGKRWPKVSWMPVPLQVGTSRWSRGLSGIGPTLPRRRGGRRGGRAGLGGREGDPQLVDAPEDEVVPVARPGGPEPQILEPADEG